MTGRHDAHDPHDAGDPRGSHAALPAVPFPGAWVGARPRVAAWLPVFTALLTVVLAIGATGAVSAGSWLVAGACALLVLFFATTTRAGLRARRWPGRRVPVVEQVDGSGLRFPYSRFAWRVMAGIVVGALPFAVLVLVAVYTQDELTRLTQVLRVLAPVLVAYAALQVWNLATGRTARGEVVISTDGVTHQTWTGEFRLGWDDVDHVWAEELSATGQGPGVRLVARSGRAAAHRATAVGLGSPATRDLPDLTIRADQVEGDPALLAHVLAFYARHPEHRPELGDERALRRASQGRAVDPELTRGGGR